MELKIETDDQPLNGIWTGAGIPHAVDTWCASIIKTWHILWRKNSHDFGGGGGAARDNNFRTPLYPQMDIWTERYVNYKEVTTKLLGLRFVVVKV